MTARPSLTNLARDHAERDGDVWRKVASTDDA